MANATTPVIQINEGKVGIGTSNPTTGKLVVSSSANQIALETGDAGDGRLNIGHFSNGAFIGTYGNDAGAADIIRFGTHSGDERMRITSAGNVGIGTTSPISKLQTGINTFSGANGMYANSRVGISNHGVLTGMMLASTYNDAAHPDYGLVFVQGPSTSSYNVWSISPDGPAKGSGLNFHYQAQSANIHAPTNAKVTFEGSTGYVGIGVSSPDAKLHVKGGDIQTTDTTGANGVLRIRSTTTGTPSYGYPNVGAGDVVIEGGGTTQRQPGVITLINDDSSISANQNLGVIQFVGKDDATNGYASSQIIGMSNTGAGTGNSGGGILRFLTSNGSTLSERMRIEHDGRVGIGVTSPGATLDVSGSFRLQSGGSTYLSIGSYSGSPYINTGTSGGTVQFGAPASNTTNIQVQGTVRATGGYKSADGTAGITGTFTFVDKASATRSLTIKNGLITAKT